MRLIIEYADGALRPAYVLSMAGSRMRASVWGFDDAVEFRLKDGRWITEDDQPVKVYFDVAAGEFRDLVQSTAEGCKDRSDALEVYLWSACAPDPPAPYVN